MNSEDIKGDSTSRSGEINTAHTPGPWVLVGWCIYPALWRGVPNDDARAQIALVSPWDGMGGKTQDALEARANSKPLVAAPDLLSIAKRWAALDGGSWNVERHAREKSELEADTLAAIRKATEVSP